MPDDGTPRTNRRTMLKSFTALTTAGALAGCSSGNDGQSGSSGDGGSSDGGGTSGSGSGGKKTTTASMETFKNKAGNEVGATFDAVKELAAEEDKSTIYSVVGIQEGMGSIKEAFDKKYPDADVGIVTGGSEKLINRWETEYQSNNVKGDVYFSTSKIQRTWKNGQTMSLSSDFMPAFGQAPEKFKDAENGNWVAVRQTLGSIFYNTELVSEDEVTAWTDPTTDSQWSGQKVGWDPTPNMALMSWLLDTQGREFFENLRDQKPRFVDSHTDLVRLCGAGEFPICFSYTHKMASFGNKLPVSYFPLDPMPSVISPAVVNNKARCPNTAILFLNFMNSKEGQNLIAETEMIPWRVEWSGFPGVYPSDDYEVDTISPEVNLDEPQQMWNEVMGPLLG